jgi:hypothetical protein
MCKKALDYCIHETKGSETMVGEGLWKPIIKGSKAENALLYPADKKLSPLLNSVPCCARQTNAFMLGYANYRDKTLWIGPQLFKQSLLSLALVLWYIN